MKKSELIFDSLITIYHKIVMYVGQHVCDKQISGTVMVLDIKMYWFKTYLSKKVESFYSG